MPLQIFAGSYQRKSFLVMGCFPDETVQKLRAFVPPMSEQLGVVRREHQRWTIHDAGELLDLLHACFEKMLRVIGGGRQRGARVIDLFFRRAAGDTKIFDAGEAAMV